MAANEEPKQMRSSARRRVTALVSGLVILSAAAAACSQSPPLVGIAQPGGPVSVAEPDVRGPLRVVGPDLIDAAGRVVLIHGVNSVAKWEPWVTPIDAADAGGHDALGPDDLAALDRDGINGVRLGVWPAALMPTPGAVDVAYLDRVQQTVDALSSHGIWVLLDLHQDVFEGMPAWATSPAAAELDATPDPTLSSLIGWSAAYVTPRSLRQWDDWWANAPVADGLGVVDAYSIGAAALAARFASHPAVIGVELVNEPFPGSEGLRCVVSGCPDVDAHVAATNARITAAIRSEAPQMPVWWEQEALFPNYAPVAAPGADTTAIPAVVSSFHTYCLDTDGGEPVTPSDVATTWCDALFDQAFARAAALGTAMDAPSVLTEFGASRSPLNVTRPARLADEHLVSWFHWHHGAYPDVVESQLVRTSAQATAGRPLSQSFDPATGAFELRYAADRTIDAPTSIVVPQRAYPDGYVAEVDGGTVTSEPDAGRLTVRPDASSAVTTVRVARR